MLKENLYVINASGEKEPFSDNKIYMASRKSGLDQKSALEIIGKIRMEAYPGIRTSEIAAKIAALLSGTSPKAAIRFSLKEAMRRLGPAGFTFEKYIAAIFYKNGYKVSLNRQIMGKSRCRYEIDFIAEKDDLVYVGECKYHNMPGERVDLKTALANHARFEDIDKSPFLEGKKLRSILVTNTKFSKEALKYSKFAKVELLGWKYPGAKGLEYYIEKERLYPITILPSLKGYLTDIFAKEGLMLVKSLVDISPEIVSRKLNVKKEEVEALIGEAKILLE